MQGRCSDFHPPGPGRPIGSLLKFGGECKRAPPFAYGIIRKTDRRPVCSYQVLAPHQMHNA
jgi:hypothetical protein